MSDRTFTTVVSLLAPRRAPETGVRALARSAVGEPLAPRSGLPGLRGIAPGPGVPRRAGLWATLRAGWHRQRTRRCLAELDARMLKDIGVSYAEAEAEANKPFWLG
ncbi:MAG TPA: DUF1127 domain-containing protein [Acetobacteraceae bacterium]|jgi:uncharacterized protein YjiS (DUF1127 family)